MTSSAQTERPALRFVCAPSLFGSEQEFPALAAFVFVAIHAVAIPFIVSYPTAAAVHAILTAAAAILFSFAPAGRKWVAYSGAYICGCEVLWRMSHAPLFWEFAKYAIAGSMLISLMSGNVRRFPALALTYALLLLPSNIKTIAALPLDRAESEISFNLSGPLLIAVATVFFANIELDARDFQRIFIAFLGPVAGLAATVERDILGQTKIVFSTESNPLLSGGYGPNQVAAVLGFGALLAALLLVYGARTTALRFALSIVAILLAAQSALTFSRGGIYCMAGALLAACAVLWRDPLYRRGIAAFALVAALGFAIIGPALNSFTSGNLAERFSDASLTHRGDLISEDLSLWAQNPLLGVGPGMAKAWHLTGLAAHTEFSRALAEHGLFGLAALVVLAILAWSRFKDARDLSTSAICAALLAWTFLYIGANAMRIAVPAFVFGLGSATFLPALSGRFQLSYSDDEVRSIH
ncbi:MAG: O-antigen ligase family protein [Acidobacteriia bacterium]|nr:O-antigen ligase family protein [Terriglobia bacterium]